MRILLVLIAVMATGCGSGFVTTGTHQLAGQAYYVRASHEYCGHTVLVTDQGVLIRFEEWSATDPQSGYRRINDEWAVAEGFGLVSRDDVSCGFRVADMN